MGRVLLKCFPSTNFSSQEKNIFIVKKKKRKERWQEDGGNGTISLKGNSAICIQSL